MAGVKFTRESAERIAVTVRTVEGSITPATQGRAAPNFAQFDYMLIGKTDAAINKGASGTISVYSGTSASGLTDTGDNITAYNRFGNVASGKWVACWTMPWGFEFVAAEC